MILAAAGVLGVASVAGAQPTPPPVPPPVPPSATVPTDPNAPPPPATGAPQTPPVDPNAPPATPPVAQPPVAPAPPAQPPVQPTPAPPPQPPLQWSPTVGAPGADTINPGAGADAKGPTKPLPWRGTTFTWNQAGSTTTFGVGRDNIGSEGEYYGWDFVFAPNFYILDLEKDKLRAFAEIGFQTELTNSDTTTDLRETLFKDMQLGLGYTRTLMESGGSDKGEYLTTGSFTGRFILPTSEASYEQGRYLTTSLGLGAQQQVKILGTKAAGLKNATVGLTGTWSHLFASNYEPTFPDVNVPRRPNASGTINNDGAGANSFEQNRLIASLTLDVNLIENLSLGTNFRVVGRFKHEYTEDTLCAPVDNAPCAPVGGEEDAPLYHPYTTFDVSLSYPVFEVVDLTIGYNNDTRAIDEGGRRRNIFYSPDAQFYLDIVANLDVIYTKVAGAISPKKVETAKTAKTAKASAAHSKK